MHQIHWECKAAGLGKVHVCVGHVGALRRHLDLLLIEYYTVPMSQL